MNDYGSFSSISCYFKQPANINYYWKFLLIIGSYYVLPSLQFVLYQSQELNNSTCYYNNRCKHDFYFIPAFNNIVSNIFYVIFFEICSLFTSFILNIYNRRIQIAER